MEAHLVRLMKQIFVIHLKASHGYPQLIYRVIKINIFPMVIGIYLKMGTKNVQQSLCFSFRNKLAHFPVYLGAVRKYQELVACMKFHKAAESFFIR